MKIAIVQFPGSNCETESAEAVFRAGMEPVPFLWNEDPSALDTCSGFFLVGGFSYEDRSRAGVIASLDPLLKRIRAAAAEGLPVLGICNGAQILVESGLVPGLAEDRIGVALTPNRRARNGQVIGRGFYNAYRHLQLSVPPERSAFTRAFSPKARIHIPLAHAEGRFQAPAPLIEELERRQQVAFRYCAGDGTIDSEFPVNPNGSFGNAAALLNPAGNVMAMMPHPERVPDGDAVFHSMRDFIRSGERPRPQVLDYQRPPFTLEADRPLSPTTLRFPVRLIITDNAALSVENALRHLGFAVRVRRRVLWEVEVSAGADPDAVREAILASGELFNANKEYLEEESVLAGGIVVRSEEDPLGEAMGQTLSQRLGVGGLERIGRGLHWSVENEDGSPVGDQLDPILRTHIFHNPVSDHVARSR